MPDVYNFLKDKNILIIGWPASGKTSMSEILSKKLIDHTVIHTDDFLNVDSQSIISKIKGRTITEGICGYRILRRGAIAGTYSPDVVIEMIIDDKTLNFAYNQIRSSAKMPHVKRLIKACQTVMSEYDSIISVKPYWIKIENNYAGNL
jgi:hypothetical protein